VPQHPTFIEELMAAGRGTLGLFVGNRQAGAYFDFSRRGLVTSFIALLLVTLLNVTMPTIMGVENESIAQNAAIVAILFLLQLAVAAIALRQLKRLDGFVPYLVADNWTTFFLTLISTALVAAGITSDFSLVVIGVVVILIEVNIARFIVTLSPMQIAIFLIAQLVGVAVGLLLIGFLFPLPPEVVAAAAGTSG
jgi:hypothetical protein